MTSDPARKAVKRIYDGITGLWAGSGRSPRSLPDGEWLADIIRSEFAEALEDTKRMDWLAQHCWSGCNMWMSGDLRAAIDAERERNDA
jgi:hypothetical protein